MTELQSTEKKILEKSLEKSTEKTSNNLIQNMNKENIEKELEEKINELTNKVANEHDVNDVNEQTKKVYSKNPQVYTVDNYLTDDECAHMISLADGKLKKSLN